MVSQVPKITPKKILIVDDEVNMRLVLKAMLKKGGYDVETAATGWRPWPCSPP